MVQLNRKITDNFEWDDFKCQCCGTLLLIPRFYKHIEILQGIRERLGFPMNVNSGHRCPFHNSSLPDSAPHSEHLVFATDIAPVFISGENAAVFEAKVHTLWLAFDTVFDGVGRYDTFVHGDLRGHRSRWDYRKFVT